MSQTPPAWKKTLLQMQLPSVFDLMKEDAAKQAPARTLSFSCTDEDMGLIHRIAARGVEMGKAYKIEIDLRLAAMDIAVVHCNGTPLHLLRFLMSDPSDFMHDFGGIGMHLDRSTGKLHDGWKPLFGMLAS